MLPVSSFRKNCSGKKTENVNDVTESSIIAHTAQIRVHFYTTAPAHYSTPTHAILTHQIAHKSPTEAKLA
jgi:hypothetical protein